MKSIKAIALTLTCLLFAAITAVSSTQAAIIGGSIKNNNIKEYHRHLKKKCRDKKGKLTVKGMVEKFNCKKLATMGLCNEMYKKGKRMFDKCPKSCTITPLVTPTNNKPVKLLTAGKFAILTKTGVTTTGSTQVTGDIGASPVAASYFTGFDMTRDSSGEFSTSTIVTDGELYAADYTPPTPNMLTVAVRHMQKAYNNAAGRSDPDFTEVGAGLINGLTLEQGLYKWGTSLSITNSLTFDGPADAVWILQVAGEVIIDSGAMITLSGGAKAENIFWQVAGKTTFGTTSHVEGVFLCKTKIVFQTGSSLNGAALAQTAVTLDAATVVKKSVSDYTFGC